MITLVLPEWLVWVFIALALMVSALATLDSFLKWKLLKLRDENDEMLRSLARQTRKASAALDKYHQTHDREDNELQ